MAQRKHYVSPAPDMPPMPRQEWSLAFIRRVDELRPDMGRKYLATVVATLWPKHHADDPEQVAAQWAAEHEGT